MTIRATLREARPTGDLVSSDWRAPRLLTARQAADHYGVSVSTIYRRAALGQIIAEKINGRWMITEVGVSINQAALGAKLRDTLNAPQVAQEAPSVVMGTPVLDADEIAAEDARRLAARRAALAGKATVTVTVTARDIETALLNAAHNREGGRIPTITTTATVAELTRQGLIGPDRGLTRKGVIKREALFDALTSW